MYFSTIISTRELKDRLQLPNWVILDCRFDLMNPAWGNEQYNSSHIPRAVFADLNNELSGPITPDSGRHPLPRPDAFIKNIANWGINPDTQVIVYDANSGGFASRAWWLLRMYGHDNVAVLDGGWQKWFSESRPISAEKEINKRVDKISVPHLDQSFYVVTEQVLNASRDADAAYCIIDVRAGERYRGEIEPIDPVAGHIPGAVNRPTSLNLSPDGTFKPAHVLRSEILALLDNTPPDRAIIYCGSGVTSCHLVLAMEIASISGAKIYAGSWSEWIRDPKRPIEKK